MKAAVIEIRSAAAERGEWGRWVAETGGRRRVNRSASGAPATANANRAESGAFGAPAIAKPKRASRFLRVRNAGLQLRLRSELVEQALEIVAIVVIDHELAAVLGSIPQGNLAA